MENTQDQQERKRDYSQLEEMVFASIDRKRRALDEKYALLAEEKEGFVSGPSFVKLLDRLEEHNANSNLPVESLTKEDKYLAEFELVSFQYDEGSPGSIGFVGYWGEITTLGEETLYNLSKGKYEKTIIGKHAKKYERITSKEVFEILNTYAAQGFVSKGSIFGSLHNKELSELEKYLERDGLVSYSYNSSFEHENTGSPWDYLVTEKGMKFYDQYKKFAARIKEKEK